MNCPRCERGTKVLESRRSDDGVAVRRRRECQSCGHRFTTYERREPAALFVRKRDGELQPFDRPKLRSGMLRAAHKRPVTEAEVDAVVAGIEREAERGGGEIGAERVGELCLDGLRELDRIAYLQFASVYRGFENPADVADELTRLGVAPLADSPSSGPQIASSPASGSV